MIHYSLFSTYKMDTLDNFTLKDLLLLCQDSVTKLGLTCKYYYDYMMSDNVLKGLYKYPPNRESSIEKVFEYFDIDKISMYLFMEELNYLCKYSNCEKLHGKHTRYAEVYAIVSNNIDYMSYLQNVGCGFSGYFLNLYVYVAMCTNNSHIVKKFYKTKDKFMLSQMAYASIDQIDSLKYVMSHIDSYYITNSYHSSGDFGDYDEDICSNYDRIIECGDIKCAKLIYELLSKDCVPSVIFQGAQHTDYILKNIKCLYGLGYNFPEDEFDCASTSDNDNVLTLEYLTSIGYKFTKEQLKQWKKHPKCKIYLRGLYFKKHLGKWYLKQKK